MSSVYSEYETSAKALVRMKYIEGYWRHASNWWDAMSSENKQKTADYIMKLPNTTGEPLFIRAYGMRRNYILKWFWSP